MGARRHSEGPSRWTGGSRLALTTMSAYGRWSFDLLRVLIAIPFHSRPTSRRRHSRSTPSTSTTATRCLSINTTLRTLPSPTPSTIRLPNSPSRLPSSPTLRTPGRRPSFAQNTTPTKRTKSPTRTTATRQSGPRRTTWQPSPRPRMHHSTRALASLSPRARHTSSHQTSSVYLPSTWSPPLRNPPFPRAPSPPPLRDARPSLQASLFLQHPPRQPTLHSRL